MKLRSGRCIAQSSPKSLADLPDEILLNIFQRNAALVTSRGLYDEYLTTAATNQHLLMVAREALFKEYEMSLIIKASGIFLDQWGQSAMTSTYWNLHGALTRHTRVELEDHLTDHLDQFRHRLLGELRAVVLPSGIRRESKPLIGPSFAKSIRIRKTRRLRVTVTALYSKDDAADAIEALGNAIKAMNSLREVNIILADEAEFVDATYVARMVLRIMQRHSGGRKAKVNITRRSVMFQALRSGTY